MRRPIQYRVGFYTSQYRKGRVRDFITAVSESIGSFSQHFINSQRSMASTPLPI